MQELVPWDDMTIEDPDDAFSLEQDDEFEPRALEPEEHQELDLIMKVQDMPKGKLNCPEFPHLILIEDPNPEKHITSPSGVIASIMKETPQKRKRSSLRIVKRV